MSTQSLQTALQVTLLPVSGRRVLMRAPTGAEELLLLEAPEDGIGLALALMAHLATPLDVDAAIGGDGEWSQLTPTDVDVFILRLRQATLGDRVTSDVRCQSDGCNARIDISFRINDYLGHQLSARTTPRRRSWLVEPAGEPGWFRLVAAPKPQTATEESGVLFRLPTMADLLMVTGSEHAAQELGRRCIRPGTVSTQQRRWVEAAMEAMAPSLAQELRGTCPECGTAVGVSFDPRSYCLRELRNRASFIYQDVDVLAQRYHWRESDILALPQLRRMSYADAARREANRPP